MFPAFKRLVSSMQSLSTRTAGYKGSRVNVSLVLWDVQSAQRDCSNNRDYALASVAPAHSPIPERTCAAQARYIPQSLPRHQTPAPDAAVWSDPRTLTFQIFCDRRKLLQCCFQFLGYLESEHVRIRKVRAVFERFVPKPENIEINFVALE